MSLLLIEQKFTIAIITGTLHKILVHGAKIIQTSVLPVGVLKEEASETQNKNYKNFTQFQLNKHIRI